MTRKAKTPTLFRLSEQTRSQIAGLAEEWHMSQAEVVTFAVNAVYRAVTEQQMKTADAVTDGGHHDPAA